MLLTPLHKNRFPRKRINLGQPWMTLSDAHFVDFLFLNIARYQKYPVFCVSSDITFQYISLVYISWSIVPYLFTSQFLFHWI